MSEFAAKNNDFPAREFSIYLKRHMALRGHNIPSIAKLMKSEDGTPMSVETVRRWVKGLGLPRRPMIEQLASVLNIDAYPLYQLAAGASLEDIDNAAWTHVQEGPHIIEKTAPLPVVDRTFELDLRSALARIAALESRIAVIEEKISTSN